MDECFKCGISGEKARLFDVIESSGIVKVCSHCFSGGSMPLIKKPTSSQLKDSEKQQTYRESIKAFSKAPSNLNRKEDVNLREIIDKNLKINISEDVKPRPYLMDNFHWVIMRARRAKHISREQFARDLGESETLVKMIEQGVLPEDDNRIINKIEGYLAITLRKPEFEEKTKKREVGFDSVSVMNLTVSDLKEMKDKKDEEIFSDSVEIWNGDIEDDSEEKVNEKKFLKESKDSVEFLEDEDLSKEDIDDLIFGK